MRRSVGRSTTSSPTGALVTSATAAVMSVVPTASAAMRPQPSTLATVGSDDAQVASQVTSMAEPSERIAVAPAPDSWPTTRRAGP
jgi:hypothetical protein